VSPQAPPLARSRIQRKLVLAFCLILLLPVTALSAYTLLRTREALIARASVEQLGLAEARASAAESMLTDISGDLLLLTQQPAIRQFSADPGRAGQIAGLLGEAVTAMLRQAPERYTGLCLLDAAGRERACVDVAEAGLGLRPPAGLGDQAAAPAFVNALRLISIPGRHPIYISPVRPGVAGQPPTIAYSTVINDDDGRIAGVLVLDVSLEPVIELLRERAPETRTSLVDDAGAFLLRPQGGAATLVEDRPGDAKLILRQRSGTLLDTADRPDTLQTFARVRPRGHAAIQWTVIYERPVTALTGELSQAQGVILLIGLVGLAGAAAMAHVITRAIARPLTVLAAAAERVGGGDLDTPFPPPGDDEIGALSATFAHTVARLRASIAGLERRTREAETIQAAALSLSASLDLPEVLNAILEALREVVPYDSASVQLLRDGKSEIIGGYGFHNGDRVIGISFALAPGATPNAEVLARRAAVIYDNVPEAFPYFGEEPYVADPIRSWLGVPLICNDRLIGMITLDRHQPAAFHDNHARLAAAFAAQAAVAIENARLYEAARAELAERRRAEAAHARLAAIIEATPDLVGMADITGRPLFLNRAGRRMVGMGDDEDISMAHIADFSTPAAVPLLMEQALPAALAHGSWSGETEFRHPDGRAIPVSQVIIAHYDAAGNPEFLSTVVRDISERRRAEEQLRQAQKMEALGRLAGGLAHDFNNILTVIRGECDLLAEDLPPGSPLRPGVDQIHTAAGRAAALTGQLLAFSRRQVLQPSVLNLNSCVERATRMLERLIGEDVALSLDLAPALAPVRVDPGQIELVLMNLAINARDAMPDGGRLFIGTANLEVAAPLAGATLGPGRWVCLSVADTGGGMDLETQAHIFEPFFTTKPRGKGTGLGLATVLGVVQQSGGDIVCWSAPGQGTRFDIFLPAAEAGPQVSPPGAAAPPSLAACTVLLVEDDAEVRRFAQAVLARQGCHVIEASDGAAALARAADHQGPIDLLLTDIVMPGGLNGVQLARAIRNSRPAIRILYMSGYSDTAQVGQSLAADEARFLQKPFSPAELATALHQALDAAAPQV